MSTQKSPVTVATFGITLALFLYAASSLYAASFITMFGKSNEQSTIQIDHSGFSKLLNMYVSLDKAGLNRVNYASLKAKQPALKAYISQLEGVKISDLSKKEQFALWANLYNAVTLNVVLDAYPVKSIKDIDISPGLFSNGPWGKKLVTIDGNKLSLDDIEHKILRVIHKDPRVHYAVNCASIGCPNIQNKAFTGAALETQLDQAASDYINSNRGVIIKNGKLKASKIYSWFKKDFGTNQKNILMHFKKYAKEPLKAKLSKITSINSYFYDWSLNDKK